MEIAEASFELISVRFKRFSEEFVELLAMSVTL